MELEHLNKTQTILLTLLVSFVTSIATGITTVTLMDQAPPGTTTTIRNVVERTVERVVQAGTPKETVKTVIVREEDAIADAIDSQSKALVRIYLPASTAEISSGDQAAGVALSAGPEFVANGFTISEDGTAVTDSRAVSEDVTYVVKLADGTTFDARPAFQDEEKGVAFLKPAKPFEKKMIIAEFGDSDSVRLGGMAIVIGGRGEASVNVGVISGFQTAKRVVKAAKEGEKDTEAEYRSGITLSVPTSAGSIILSGNGVVIGMGVGPDGKTASVPANLIKELIASIPPPKDLTQ